MASANTAKQPKHPFPLHVVPSHSVLVPAKQILVAANDSAHNFYLLWHVMRDEAKGTTRDYEQDLLRAMLVFACAGLDNMMKRVIRDALPLVVERDSVAGGKLTEYAESRIAKRDTDRDMVVDHRLLARLLLAPSPRAGFVEELCADLTADSLQSKGEVMRVLAHFGVEQQRVCPDPVRLDVAFKIRNKIVHEMDVDLTGKTRKRTSRRLEDMTVSTKLILDLGAAFLLSVEAKLKQTPIGAA